MRGGHTGIVYISYIPPKLKANKIRALLTKHGAEVLRIYLAAEDSMSALRRKKAGGKRGKRFTEG
jgi:ESF2/ABP1 family protein